MAEAARSEPAPDWSAVTLDDVRAQMDAPALIVLDTAIGAAMRVKLAQQLQAAHARIADLEKQKAPGATGPGDVDE